jgi:nitrite reductase/ring-hydroxylating ferredoxin subunit
MASDRFARLLPLADLPPGAIRAVRLEDEDVALYNVDGAVYATRDSCTHESFPLSRGALCGRVVTCALHHWKYDVTTGRCETNPAAHVRRYETKVEDGWIHARLVALPPPEPPKFVSRDDA